MYNWNMNKEELMRLRERARQKYLQDIAAIDRVLSLMNSEGESKKSPQTPSLPLVVEKEREKRPTDVLREIIGAMPGNFDLHGLEEEYEKRKPTGMEPVNRRYLALLLSRMEGKGQVKQVERGRGKRPSKYHAV